MTKWIRERGGHSFYSMSCIDCDVINVTDFTLPGAADRTVVIGMTGTGKTIGAAFLLSKQRFDKRPWLILDFKDEEFWDDVGNPPIRNLKIGQKPPKTGLYRVQIRPGQDEQLEDYLWKIWEWSNIGIVCDEASLLPKKEAFKAILRQGRSKHIPVIACTQRPVDCDREVFTESQYAMIYRVKDKRDTQIIRGFIGDFNIEKSLPQYWSYWYDAKQDKLSVLRPVPPPDTISSELRTVTPYSWFGG